MADQQRSRNTNPSARWNRPSPKPNTRNRARNTNARTSYEKYVTLAQAAASAGDTIETENCYQHAEHYFRMMSKQSDDE
jgi:hypothetical protein